MGGVAKTIGQGVGDVVTLGTDRIKGSPMQKFGQAAGTVFTAGLSKQWKGLTEGDSQSFTPGQAGGQMSPMDTLTSSGGAPLLMDIALGADPATTIMSYFGASGSWDKFQHDLPDQQSRDAVQGLMQQLTQIQSDTNSKNLAVQQLAQDYPNIMAQKIPQYSAMADSATQQMMDQALKQISAKQAAGGMFSSGATAEAAANAGANIAMQKLQFGTGLALQDFNQLFNQASASQQFQQKMLGQGAQNGFNAVQNALAGNRQLNLGNAEFTNQANQLNTQMNNQQNQALWGSLGRLAGLGVTSMFMNPGGRGALPNGGGMTPVSFPQGDAQLNMPLSNPSGYPGGPLSLI